MNNALSPTLNLACALTRTDTQALSQCGHNAQIAVYWQLLISVIQFCFISGFTYYAIYSTFNSNSWAVAVSLLIGLGIVVMDIVIISNLIKPPIEQIDIRERIKRWWMYSARIGFSLIIAYALGSAVETKIFEGRINRVILERDKAENQEILQSAKLRYENDLEAKTSSRDQYLKNVTDLNTLVNQSNTDIETIQKEIALLSSTISLNERERTKQAIGWDGANKIAAGKGDKWKVADDNVKAFTKEKDEKIEALKKLVSTQDNNLTRLQNNETKVDALNTELKSLSLESYLDEAVVAAKISNQWVESSKHDQLEKREVLSEILANNWSLFIYALVIKLCIMALEFINLLTHMFKRPTEYASKLLVLEKIRVRQALLDCEYQMAKLATEHSSKMEALDTFDLLSSS